MSKRVIGAALGSFVGLMVLAAPAMAAPGAPATLTVTAMVVDQQCQGGDFVNVTLSAAADSSSQVRGFRWDFNNDGRWDTGVLTDPTVVHRYPDERNVTARVGAKNVEGNVATDTVTFSTIRCGSASAAVTVVARRSGGVSAEGSCTAGSTWKLTANPQNTGIEVDFEVDSNVVGQTWQVRLSDNGTLFARGKATTQGGGSFTIKRLTANQSGDDVITAQAKNPATGEVCAGSVTLPA